MPASEAWARALQEIDNTWALTAADTAILRDLGPNLGTSDRQDQSRYLQMAMKQLEGELGRAEELASKNGRLWRWLGLLGGLFLALLLL
ncbi:MAG: stage sporulation protein [Eubacteriales bacterium]|nr:stage sporulation protein [Eubacteriales bacterium]MDN5364452.1 stage sporulation protein [Eubacteriales bacterium]